MFTFFLAKCVDQDANCPGWANLCGTDPYVIDNCLLTCDSTCSGEFNNSSRL